MSDATKLQEMVDGYPEQIQNQEDSITELTAIAADLQEQREAIENVVMATATTDSDAFLAQKSLDLGVGSCGGTCSVCTSGGYGVTNLTDWAIVSGGCPPAPHKVVYKNADVTDTDQITRVSDFAAAYNHIWQELGTDGTYGIKPTRDSVNTGKSIVNKNKDKTEQVQEIYTRYLP